MRQAGAMVKCTRYFQVELNLKNRYIPTSEYILSFKDKSSLKEIGKSMQKTY